MAMSHHFEARTTLAFIHGWDIFSNKLKFTKKPIVPHIEAIQEILKSSRRLLSYPLLLPTLFLRRHLTRAEDMRRQLSSMTAEIEKAIGVTQTARLSGRTVQDQRIVEEVKAMVLGEKPRIHTTARISTTATDVINMKETLEWDEEYVKFLRRVNDDVKAHPREAHTPPEADLQLCGFIDLLERDAQSISSYATRMQSRLELQFNVLYNLVAQAGNSLNMQQSTQAGQVAAQAGMDSTAMKTMAVVTMVFLPPTFVAVLSTAGTYSRSIADQFSRQTIFSMSFFNWQASSSSGDDGGAEPTVVPQFWIYWAVSLPFTIAIVIGWRVWWHFQKAYYETKFLTPEEHVVYEDRSRERSRDRTHDPRRRRSRYQAQLQAIYTIYPRAPPITSFRYTRLNHGLTQHRNAGSPLDERLVPHLDRCISRLRHPTQRCIRVGSRLLDQSHTRVLRERNAGNSLCFGLYDTATSQKESSGSSGTETKEYHQLIGFARVVTDFVSFAYTTDVWVDPTLQGKGLGRWLVGCVQEVLEPMPYLRKSVLATDSWDKSVPFYEKMMKMSVIGGQPGGQAIMQMKGKGSPGYTEKTD
ncbi:hypothetical protein CCUS01_01930 [Colletotrichum cuscutae]|uniref:N-acetyltransferase domain-containing protein n=1 Tax=Colletotrichum cuscutae TaxID=1209917 RepID=A0AAI9U946_9PEZI|nr:hypothetical protein CCUS01_01930 [Colletotrichum cuscutae]